MAQMLLTNEALASPGHSTSAVVFRWNPWTKNSGSQSRQPATRSGFEEKLHAVRDRRRRGTEDDWQMCAPSHAVAARPLN
jgi:hypothetical protein